MQCDITNIIRDTGPADSSGIPSRAESNITTPANCQSDNDELDESTSAKNSLNPSRESSLPPEETKREPILGKSKDPTLDGIQVTNDPKDEKISIPELKIDEKKCSLVVTTEETESSIKSETLDTKSENTAKSCEHSENKVKSEVSISPFKDPKNLGSEQMNQSSVPVSNYADAMISENISTDDQSEKVESHSIKLKEKKEVKDSAETISIESNSSPKKSSAKSDHSSIDLTSNANPSTIVKPGDSLKNTKTHNDSSTCKTDVKQTKNELEQDTREKDLDSKSQLQNSELKSLGTEKSITNTVEKHKKKEKHSNISDTVTSTKDDKLYGTQMASTSKTLEKDSKDVKGKHYTATEKDMSSERTKGGVSASATSPLNAMKSGGNVGSISPQQPSPGSYTKQNVSIKHPIASMLSDTASKEQSVSDVSEKPPSQKPKHSIESMLSSSYKPSTEKIQPHRPIGQMNMVTPFIPVISSQPVKHHSRPLIEGNSPPGALKKNEDSLGSSHLPPKRPLKNENKPNVVIPGSSSEKKPKLDLTNEKQEANTGSSVQHPDVGTPIVEPVKKITGNGSGSDNTSINNVFGEISEPVLFILGRGMGKDCNVGNPRTQNGRQKTTNGYPAAKKEPKGVKKDVEEKESGSEEEENNCEHPASKQGKFRGRGRPRGRGRGRGRSNNLNSKNAKQRKRSDSSDKDISGESEASGEEGGNVERGREKSENKITKNNKKATNDDSDDQQEESSRKTHRGGTARGRGRPPGSGNKKSSRITENGSSGSLKDFHQPKAIDKPEEEDDADTQELVSRLSRRSSGRIAMIRIKETERRQREEEEALEEFKNIKEPKKKRKKESDDSSDDETVIESKKRKRKKKKKPEELRGQEHLKQFSKFSSGSESGEEEEEGEEIEEEVAEAGDQDDLFKSDHEFSGESDVPDDDYEPVKHARTATNVGFKIEIKCVFITIIIKYYPNAITF